MKRIILAALLAAVVAAPAGVAGRPAPLPPEIVVPEWNKTFLTAYAIGVQTYKCVTPGEWTFISPFAYLYAKNGKFLGTHFGGPTWQAKDGSYVKAAKVKEVTVDSAAIPWLLLKTTAVEVGNGDRLSRTTYVQRIRTAGGLAPAGSTCDAAKLGEYVDVPYTAQYVFWKSKGRA